MATMPAQAPEAPVADYLSQFDLDDLNRQLDIAKSKVFIGSNAAFMAPIMSSLDFEWAEVGTAATDGKSFFWDPRDFLNEPLPRRVSTILHEIDHNARLHFIRGKGKHPEIWNWACDIVINRGLVADGYEIGPNWVQCHPEIPYESEEDIYSYLEQKVLGGEWVIPDNIEDHLMEPAISPEEMINNCVRAIHQANLAGQPGAIPGNVEQIVKSYLAPIVNWEAELIRFFTELFSHEYSMARPNRRYINQDIYRAGIVPDDGKLTHLAYYLDVSGSITNRELRRFNSEVKYIKETFNPQKLSLIQFDTRISHEMTIKDNDAFDELRIVGGGGTSLAPVKEHIEETKPTAAIIFSDLECAPMGKLKHDIPVIWISTTAKKGAFGRTIRIKA